MSESKKFIAVMIATTVVAMSLIAAFHWKLDRYRVFSAMRGDFSLYYARDDGALEGNHNDRFIPMAYLLDRPHDFDRFILGASKVSSLDARRLGPEWYKLNYNDATLDEHLHNLEILIANIDVREVVLAIDERTFVHLGTNSNYKSELYPADALEWLRLLGRYLVKPIDEKDLRMFLGIDYHLEPHEDHHLRVEPAARYDRDHAADPAFFDRGLRRMRGLPYRRFAEERVSRALDTLADIERLAEANDIRFRVYMQPLHYKNVYHLDNAGYLDVKRRLASVSDFYDFSAPHNYMINNAFWKELLHFFRGLSDEIVRKLQGDETRCPGFGVLVTNENARASTERMRIESKVLIPYLEGRDRRFRTDPGLRSGEALSDEDAREVEARLLRDCLQFYGDANSKLREGEPAPVAQTPDVSTSR